MLRDVHPKAAMAADAGSALDGKADGYWIFRLGRNVNVLARHVRRAIVLERQQVHFVGNHGSGDHVEERRAGSGGASHDLLVTWCRVLACR